MSATYHTTDTNMPVKITRICQLCQELASIFYILGDEEEELGAAETETPREVAIFIASCNFVFTNH